MRLTAALIGCVLSLCLLEPIWALQVSPARAQHDRPWWISAEMGDGQIQLSSDRLKGDRVPTFAFGLAGGHRAGRFMRAGMKANGWQLQASNLNDPTVGESVGNVMGIVDVFPARKGGFVRGGLGYASYTNNRPEGSNGSGLGWEAGAGYEFPIRNQFRLAPIVEYNAGSFGDAYQPIAPVTGRRYSVIEFKLSLVYRFGGNGG